MISAEAYQKLKSEVAEKGFSAGVLSESVHLYLIDYYSVKVERGDWHNDQIETTLLRPTGVTSLVLRASENYLASAKADTKNFRMLGAVASSSMSVVLGVLANIIFTLLMIGFFLSATDVSATFFEGLGFRVVPITEADLIGGDEKGEDSTGVPALPDTPMEEAE